MKINFKSMDELVLGTVNNLDVIYVVDDDYELYEAVAIYEDGQFKLYTNTEESWEIISPLAWSPALIDEQDIEEA